MASRVGSRIGHVTLPSGRDFGMNESNYGRTRRPSFPGKASLQERARCACMPGSSATHVIASVAPFIATSLGQIEPGNEGRHTADSVRRD